MIVVEGLRKRFGGREVLVPSVFVIEQRDGVIVIDPPEGLLDLGAGA